MTPKQFQVIVIVMFVLAALTYTFMGIDLMKSFRHHNKTLEQSKAQLNGRIDSLLSAMPKGKKDTVYVTVPAKIEATPQPNNNRSEKNNSRADTSDVSAFDAIIAN